MLHVSVTATPTSRSLDITQGHRKTPQVLINHAMIRIGTYLCDPTLPRPSLKQTLLNLTTPNIDPQGLTMKYQAGRNLRSARPLLSR
jgi:hypothetical protein